MTILYANEGCRLDIKRGRALVAVADFLYGAYLKAELMTDGYDVEWVTSGHEVMDCVYREEWQLLILDYEMLDMSGLEVCRRVRLVSRLPILMCAKDFSSAEIVAALDCGADACFLRKTSSEEVLAQTQSLRRRIHWESVPCHDIEAHILRFKDLELNQVTLTLKRGDYYINLSDREFQLLSTLMGHVNIVLRRSELLRWIWGYPAEAETRVLDTYIGRLREKLYMPESRDSYITTIRNIGYVMRTLTIGQ